MGINYNKSHIFTNGIRNATYDTNGVDFVRLYDFAPTDLSRLPFKTTCTLQFMVDKPLFDNKILWIFLPPIDTRPSMGGGTEVLYNDPTKVNWCIINKNGYLYLYLHEIDGIHSLVFKTNNRVLNTLKRKHFAFKYNVDTNSVILLIDSLNETLTLDTTNPNYRTNINQFTGIQNLANSVFLGGGGIDYFPTQYSTHSVFYDSYIDRELTDSEINLKYNVIKDTRELPPPNIGKILISSDRGANGYDIYRVNGDFTDPILEVGDGAAALYYPRWSRNTLVDDFTFVSYEGSPSYPKVKLGNNIYYAYDFYNPVQGLVLNWYNGALAPTLDIDNKIHGFGLGNTGGSQDTSFWEIDPANTANSQIDFYNTPPINAISVFGGNLLRYAGSSDSHPINRDKIVVEVQHDTFGCRIVIWDRVTNTIDNVLYTDSYAGGNRNTMYQPKFNYNGTRVGFTTHLNFTYPVYSNKHAFVVNYDGSNLVDLGVDIDFLCFCSKGSEWDKTVSFSRPLVDPEVIHFTLNGVPLANIPFNTDMNTTLNDLKTELLLQLGVDTVIISGNTIRIKMLIDNTLDISINITGNVTSIISDITVNNFGVDTEVLIQKYELSLTYSLMYYRIYKKNLRTLAEINLSGDVPYNDYWADWKL